MPNLFKARQIETGSNLGQIPTHENVDNGDGFGNEQGFPITVGGVLTAHVGADRDADTGDYFVRLVERISGFQNGFWLYLDTGESYIDIIADYTYIYGVQQVVIASDYIRVANEFSRIVFNKSDLEYVKSISHNVNLNTQSIGGTVANLTLDYFWNQVDIQSDTDIQQITMIGGSECILVIAQVGAGDFEVTGWPSNLIWSNGVPPVISRSTSESIAIKLFYNGSNIYGYYDREIGVSIGELIQLEDVGGGTPGLPAVDGSQLTGLPSGSDINVRVSSNDTTTGDLSSKLTSGIGIQLIENNDGGNENLQLFSLSARLNGCVVGDPNLDLNEVTSGSPTLSMALDDLIYFPYHIPITTAYDGFRLFFTSNTPSDSFQFALFTYNSSSGDFDRILLGTANTVGDSAFGGTFTSINLSLGYYVAAIRRVGQGFAATTPMRGSDIMHPAPSVYSNMGSLQSLLQTSQTSIPTSYTPVSDAHPYPASPGNSFIPYIPLVVD